MQPSKWWGVDRVGAVMASGVVVLLALVLASCGAGRGDDDPIAVGTPDAEHGSPSSEPRPDPSPSPAVDDAPEGWSALPPGPLSARHGPELIWVAGELLVIGGQSTDPCPPGASCVLPDEPALTDGARWSWADGWDAVALMPTSFLTATTTVVDGIAYVLGEPWPGTDGPPFVAYDPRTDAWQELPLPTDDVTARSYALAAGDGHVVLFQRSHESGRLSDWRYDPTAEAWSELPEVPLGDHYDRDVTWVGDALVVTGIPVEDVGADGPATYEAAVWNDDGWRVLPRSEVAGWSPDWLAVDGLLVNPIPGSVDGGQVNPYDRAYPTGGILNVNSGTWAQLPGGSATVLDGPLPNSVGDDQLLVGANAQSALVDRATRWVPLGLPTDVPSYLAGVAVGNGDLYVAGGTTTDDEGQLMLSSDVWVWNPPDT